MSEIYILELESRYVGELNSGFSYSRSMNEYTFESVQRFLMDSPLYKHDVTMNTYCIDGDESKQSFQKALLKFTDHVYNMVSVEDDLKTVLNYESSNYDKIKCTFRKYKVM